jgi:hypothetical protein
VNLIPVVNQGKYDEKTIEFSLFNETVFRNFVRNFCYAYFEVRPLPTVCKKQSENNFFSSFFSGI